MSVIANAQLTVTDLTDVAYIRQYYLIQDSILPTPDKPTSSPPGGNWATTEQKASLECTDSETGKSKLTDNSLYTVVLTAYTNGEYDYSDVSLSSSYAAAKEAYSAILDVKSSYVAQSDFGTLEKYFKNYLEANGQYVEQDNTYVQTVTDGLQKYIEKTQGFIRSGIIGMNEKNEPIEGIMIAQKDITEESLTAGSQVKVLKGPAFYSTLTSDELAFWVGGSDSDTQNNNNMPTQLASVSNQELNVDKAVVNGYLAIGSWHISKENGLTVKWVG